MTDNSDNTQSQTKPRTAWDAYNDFIQEAQNALGALGILYSASLNSVPEQTLADENLNRAVYAIYSAVERLEKLGREVWELHKVNGGAS